MTDKKQEARGEVTQGIWVGDPDALYRLVKAVGDIRDYARQQQLAELVDGIATRRGKFDVDYAWEADDESRQRRWLALEANLRSEVESISAITMKAKQKRWSLQHSGEPQDVIADMDVEDVTEIEIAFGEGYNSLVSKYMLVVTLDERRANAQFRGPEPIFVDLAAKRLEEEFRRQRPWYWWLDEGPGALVLLAMAAITSAILGVWMFNLGFPPIGTTGILSVVVVGLFSLAVWGVRKMVKSFELVKDESQAAGRRRFKIAGIVIAWVAATIVIPLILALVA
ncbi:hypothetical protein [Microbacterium rhizomatis]|uniref:Uncharacterized protein n=1 Tax=Microbacterium rhizomatis TaxID=1631477 RepID=A0A5J5J5H1_9MICO|nr:hypothetical protein [Microbacterium rhizomatis]KAA9110374.1 hypothetical protein F6B43_01380 [Microbacterium rhizomatis]